jgi:hypothetical protein
MAAGLSDNVETPVNLVRATAFRIIEYGSRWRPLL